MTCSDVRRILPEILDCAPDSAFQTEFDAHVKSCRDCSDLMSDLELIASEARQLAATEDPGPRVWLGIAAQLREEGLIREPESVPTQRPILVPPSEGRRWTSTAWWLAPVAAMLLVAGSYVVSRRPGPQVVAKLPTSAPSAATPTSTNPASVNPTSTGPTSTNPASNASASATAPDRPQLAQKSAKPANDGDTVASAAKSEAEPEPSADDRQFLSVVSTRAPSMRATYESQLRAVNSDIREVQAYLQQNPGDADARQHLMDAYQQKALLYQMALDRIQ